MQLKVQELQQTFKEGNENSFMTAFLFCFVLLIVCFFFFF